MLPKLLLLATAGTLLLASCSKQVNDVSANTTSLSNLSASASAQAAAKDPGWFGFYAGPDVSNSDTLFAADFIKNGVAKLPFYSNDSDVFSRINYRITPGHNIPGDSLIYEVKIKNPKDRLHADWDVTIDIKGAKNEAFVNFVADSAYIQRTRAFVGNAEVTGVPQLVHDFEKFTALKLILQNDKATIRLDGVKIASFDYGAANRLGRIKSISFGGKGYPTCTDVKLANSYTNNLILTENFNTDGKSTIVYY